MAAFIPGCILGGASLVFKDIVEGMGCLLGGFCFGMWVMTLKAGGTADSVGARAGVIAGLAGGGFSLSFSHHTREPGLIACLSFAGATVIVLGIDLFSRAGLAYFWLYIWDLNDKLFPLGTHTYPMTRGIKVEVAAIVIIAVCGAMSQMRLWKIIKERRAKRAEQRQRDEEERAVLDEKRNQEFTKQHNKDRKHWERDFGEGGNDSVSVFSQSQVDSAMRDSTSFRKPSSLKSLPKPVLSLKDVHHDAIELSDVGSGSRRSSQATMPTPHAVTSKEPFSLDGHRAKQSNPDTLQALEKISERPSRAFTHGDQSEQSLVSRPSGPEVTPLPFKVPLEEDRKEGKPREDDDDVKSIATAGESLTLDEVLHAPGKDRGPLTGRKLKRASGPTLGFDVPHMDDARSSVAATLDGISSHDGSLPPLSRSGTPLPGADDHERESGLQLGPHQRNRSVGDLFVQASNPISQDNTKDVDANRRHSMHLPSDKPQSDLGSLSNLSKPNDLDVKGGVPALVATHARSNSDGSGAKKESKPAALTKESLPEGQSQTVGLYRTNEWAKHQALAETPEYDELAPPSEPGVTVEYGKEAAAPVNVKSLQQSAFRTAESRAKAKSSSKNPYRTKPEATRSPSSQSINARTSAGPAVPVYSSFNSYSAANRSSSNPNSSASNLNLRSSSSNLLNQTVPESPSEDAAGGPGIVSKASRPSQQLLKSIQNSQSKDNLIRLREDKLKTRMSTMSFAVPEASTSTVDSAGLESKPSSGDGGTPNATQSNSKLAKYDDDIPLSARRNTLKEKRASSQQASQHYQLNRTSSNPYHTNVPYNIISAANAGTGGRPYDSHQPQRGSTVDPATRDSRLASWRASMASPANPSQPTLVPPGLKIEASRQHMLEAQRRQGEEHAKKEMDQRMKDNAMDQKMRSGDIAELHKKKMRQMQRQASQNAGE